MGNNQHQRPKSDSNKKTKETKNQKVAESYVGFSDALFSFLTAIFLGIGSILASDAQFRWPGVFFFIGGIVAGACGIFIHAHHRVFRNEKPNIRALLLFASAIVFLITLGASQWWFLATKDRDSFNVAAGKGIFTSGPNNPDGPTPVFAAAFLPNEIVTHFINRLLYVQVTNKKSTPTNLVGISMEVGGDKWWWPSWTKMCPVSLISSRLAMAMGDGKAAFFSDGNNLENKVIDKPIPSAATVSGWMACECPPGQECKGKYLRIGLSDASGTVSWQIIDEPAIEPNLQIAGLRPTETLDLSNSQIRNVSDCRK
jgi:hypothetical protein